MSADMPADSPDDLRAREILLGVLNAFDVDDRAVVCDYIFKDGPDRDKLEPCSTVRYQAACMVDALALDIRFDSGVDPGFFTQHLHDEARDWIVWAGGFSIAQDEVERSYARVRRCERWAREYPWGHGTVKDDRPILVDFCQVLERNIAEMQVTPTPGAARTLPPCLPRVMYRALVMLLHFMIGLLAMICAMGYREGFLDWEWFFPWVYMIFVSVPLGGLLVCSHERYCVKRKDDSPAALMKQNIHHMREHSRRWLLLWNALLALAQYMLACEDWDEDRRRQFLRIIDRVEERFAHKFVDMRPLFESIDRALLCRPGRDGLAEAVVARLLSFAQRRAEGPRRQSDTSDITGDDSGASDAPSQLQRDLHIVLEEACTDLGIVDPLFKVIAIGQYVRESGAGPRRWRSRFQCYPHDLVVAIPTAVDASRALSLCSGVLSGCTGLLSGGVHNMHARLAWIGGLGRAQDDIAAQIALFRQDPGAEQVERLAHTIEHHLNALGDSSVPSFRDLARLRGGTGNKTLILIEILKIVSFIPACLLLAATPHAPNEDLDCIVLIIYSVIALVPSFLLGSLALVGFFDHAFAHRGVTEMQGAHTAAAQLEHYARYHLVGWAALLRLLKSDSDSDIAERVAAVKEALFENIVTSASAHSISQTLDYKVDGPRFSSDVDFYRSSARVVRGLMDTRYPHFRGAVQKCGNKRVRAGYLDARYGGLTLASGSENAWAPLRYRYRSERFQDVESSV